MFTQIKLNYESDALSPVLSKDTVETHYGKHHATYAKNLNDAAKKAGVLDKDIEDILKNLDDIKDDSLRTAILNNGGGFYNHNIYFEQFKSPSENNLPVGKLKEKIDETFSDFNTFKEKLSALSVSQFGSGWAWLSSDKDGNLYLSQSKNQENPLTDKSGHTPLLTIDVWEHAYYIDYKNLRPKYVDEIFKIIDWDVIERRYEDVIKG